MYFCHIKYHPLNFSTYKKSKETFFKLFAQNLERFATNFRTHFLCFCHTFCIPIYFTNYDNNFSTSFYSFHCSSFLMFIKRNCVIETFAHFSIKICIRFSSIIFLIFHFFEFGCLFFFFAFVLYLCVFVNVYMPLICLQRLQFCFCSRS